MNRSLALPGLAIAALVFVAACTSATAGTPASQAPKPSAPVATPVATTTPSVTPTPVVSPTPIPVPSEAPSERPSAEAITVNLENATGHDVSIEILDDGHHVVDARSGRPGDGASVEFGTVVARNLDARTVQFTWSDTPGDAELGLYVSESVNVVLVIRPERDGGDAIAFDRVLIVEFDAPVDAAALHLGVQEGLDTAG
jgi:hypothetical protein